MPVDTPSFVPPATLIIGAGRLGTSLGEALRRAAWPVVLVARGDAGAARASVRGLDVVRSLGDAPSSRLVLLCVPDDAVTATAAALAATPGALAAGSIVLHTSGAVPVTALAALAPLTAGIGSLHPLQTVTEGSDAEALRGAPAAVSGDPEAIAAAEQVAQAVGLVPFRLADEAKPLYHAASAMAANFTVAVLDASIVLATAAGMPEDEARAAFTGLARTAVDRVARLGAPAALTGPIARGDVGTVRAHLEAMRHSAPDLVPLYIHAARRTLHLARRAGLDAEPARAIEAALHNSESE